MRPVLASLAMLVGCASNPVTDLETDSAGATSEGMPSETAAGTTGASTSQTGSESTTGDSASSAGTGASTAAGSGSESESGSSGGTTGEATTGSTGTPMCECPDDFPCFAGGCARFVFASSEIYAGSSFQGRATADLTCGQLAEDAGLPGSYAAFLAIDEDFEEASGRLGMADLANARFALPPVDDPVLIADDPQRFFSGAQELSAPILADEMGTPFGAADAAEPCNDSGDSHTAWTGLGATMSSGDCMDWNFGNTTARVGLMGQTDSRWYASDCDGNCIADAAHLYCFQLPP